MKYIFLSLLLLVLVLPVAAQPLSGSSNYEQLLAAADSARITQNWFVALENYEEAYDQFEEEELLPTIALMNLNLRDIQAAVRRYKQVFRRSEESDTTNNIHRYHYGRALKMDGQYDEARTYFENFLLHNEDDRLEAFTRLELEGIRLYRDAPQETSEVAIEILDRKVNSSFSEYSPILSADGNTLYFSTWKSTEAVAQTDANDDGQFSRIFMSTKDNKGNWGKPEALDKEVNRPGVSTANPSISTDGRRLYYNRLALSSHKITDAKIYVSDVDDNGWKSGNPVSGINGPDHLSMQPAVGELFGNEVLFFVSDMDGGIGGLDIYYAPYEGDGRYGTPVNLGPTINTIGDEVTPFYFDGTLYFSTNGRPTMGGFDLFYAAWDGSKWSEPENMGTGFNSFVDDQSLSVFGDGLVGFMTSNREGGRSIKSKTCCDDIYGFQIASLYANLVVGLFSEARQPLTNGTIELQPVLNDEPVGAGQQKTRDDGNRFDFGLILETEYQVIANHPGYYPDTVYLNTLGLEESKEFQQVFFLKPIPVPEADVPVYDTVSIEEAIVLENILYDFDKADIRPEAENDLRVVEQIMKQYPEMVIELGSHTDSRGIADYNQRLSKRRADSARRWLIVNGGIAGPRIKTKGYGKTVPQTASARLAERIDFLNEGDVLTDDFINGLADEETRERAHELNRRTEFKIIEGPTNIVIRRDVIERKLDGPNRNALPQGPVDPSPKQDSITRFSSLYGQTDVEGLPILQFSQRQIALGKVKKGDTRTFTYTFTNTGDVPAKIMLIQACSCTSYEHDNSIIYQPGESGSIEVTFDSEEKDEDETIVIDIFLEQTDKRDVPILEMVEYSYELTQ
jgi:peptidoglycan-associated lipoprotein